MSFPPTAITNASSATIPSSLSVGSSLPLGSSLLSLDDSVSASTVVSALSVQPLPLTNSLLTAAADPQAIQAFQQQQMQHVSELNKNLDLYLPSRTWSKLPVTDCLISELKLQHGNLPSMQVKIIHAITPNCAQQLDQAMIWLHESIGQPYPVLGFSVESDASCIRLLALSTASRAILIRTPDRNTLLKLAQETAQASLQANAALFTDAQSSTKLPPPSHLFSPLFYQLLSNRQIFKSSFEACSDALQLYKLFDFSSVHPSHPKLEINSGLNIRWNLMQRRSAGAFPTSKGETLATLEAAVDGIIGAKNSFRADHSQTFSNWGAETLSLRQIIYASLNAQVSYVVACTQNLPTPFHISDLPRSWIIKAAGWRTLHARQAEMLSAISLGLTPNEDESDTDLVSAQQLGTLTEFYSARYTQGEEIFNPFITTILHLSSTFPPQQLVAQQLSSVNPASLDGSGLSIESSNAHWYFDGALQVNERLGGAEVLDACRGLDGPQRQALEGVDQTRISVLDGGAGVGKSSLLSAIIVHALSRSSTIPLANASQTVRLSSQRVLVIAEAPSLVSLTTLLSRFLPPQRVCCLLSQNEDIREEERKLQESGYLHSLADPLNMEQDPSAVFMLDKDVLLLTSHAALFHPLAARLLRCRQTLVFEDAQQLWLLKAVLLLRKLPHTERLIISGDSAGLVPHIGGGEGESVLSTALHAADANLHSNQLQSFPPPFRPLRFTLRTSYRCPPHLIGMLSTLFYGSHLRVDDKALSAQGCVGRKKRAVGWVDVPSITATISARGSWSNSAEVASIIKLWEHYVIEGAYSASDIALIALHHAQKRELIRAAPSAEFRARIFSPEQAVGAEFAVTFLLLSAPGVSVLMSDTRRALVSLSRSTYKLFIVGDRSALGAYHSIWSAVDEYEEQDVSPEIQRAEIEAKNRAPDASSLSTVEGSGSLSTDLMISSLAPTRTQSGISDLGGADIPSPASSSAGAALLPTPLIPGASTVIATEDLPRLANLYSIFLTHAPDGQPLLIDNIGKAFKAKFGSSWRNFEKLDREAKLIHFLQRFPSMFQLSQNLDESVHVCVQWVGNEESVAMLTAAAPRGLLLTATAGAPPPIECGGGNGGLIDPFALLSVGELDSSIPALDIELIDGLFQAILSAEEAVSLSDLSKCFKQFHRRNWQEWTDLKLGEFLRKYSPSFFKFKTNKENARNPLVEVVLTGLIPDPATAAAAAAAAAASSANEDAPKLSMSNPLSKDSLRRQTSNRSDSSLSSLPLLRNSSNNSNSYNQDIYTAASSLSQVPANQIDDNFRLECLRLVFLHHQNAGLQLTDIGNSFHGLHGLRWKRLTKTEHRVSDFMYEYENEYFQFEYATEYTDDEGNANPMVYFNPTKLDTALFTPGGTAAGAANRSKSLKANLSNSSLASTTSSGLSLLGPPSRSTSNTSTISTMSTKEAVVIAAGAERTKSSSSANVVIKHSPPLLQMPSPVVIVASTSTVVKPSTVVPASKPSAPVSTAATNVPIAKPAQPAKVISCAFCQTIIPTGEKACPSCDLALDDEDETVEAASSTKAASNSKKETSSKPAATNSAQAKKNTANDKTQKKLNAKVETNDEEDDPSPPSSPVNTAAVVAQPERDLYAGISENDYLSKAALELMSKKERRKLSWLCPSCKGCNLLNDNKCALCDEPKPKPEQIRYKNPVTQLSILHEKAGTGGKAPSASGAATASASSASNASDTNSLTASNKSAKGDVAISPARYENEWVRIHHTAELGYHYVAKQPIPAGTVFLQDDVIWSSSAGALESAVGSCIPNEAQFSELIGKLLKDPVLLQLLSSRQTTQYSMVGKLLNLKKPRDVGMKEWSAGVEMTLTGAQFHREQAPGHSKSCNCSFGRFWMKRQSALLVHSCWPNCAHVHAVVKRPPKMKDVHSILATCDIPAGAVLSDCMNAALLALPKDRRAQWVQQTTGKNACLCDRCKNPRKADAQLTALTSAVKGGAASSSAAAAASMPKLEEDYDAIIKQYSKLNSMSRTVSDDPSLNNPQFDENYFEACFIFLGNIFEFLNCYSALSPLHWRKQYLRNLFVTVVAKNELYDLDLMHPDARRLEGQRDNPANGRGRMGKFQSILNPLEKGYEERRARNHMYLQMILSVVLQQLEGNAQFYHSHEPMKCSTIFLMYSLIDWFDKEENENCLTTHTLEGGKEVHTTCFNFSYDRRKKDIAGYLSDKLKTLEPCADSLLKLGFPLRA